MDKLLGTWEPAWDTVRDWRMRWIGWQGLSLVDFSIVERLSDAPRPGRPAQMTAAILPTDRLCV